MIAALSEPVHQCRRWMCRLWVLCVSTLSPNIPVHRALYSMHQTHRCCLLAHIYSPGPLLHPSCTAQPFLARCGWKCFLDVFLAEINYKISVKTGHAKDAGTTTPVSSTLWHTVSVMGIYVHGSQPLLCTIHSTMCMYIARSYLFFNIGSVLYLQLCYTY